MSKDIQIEYKQYAQPPVVADLELDEILTSLDAYRLNQGITTGGVSFTVEEHYAMYPELEKAKAALLQREQRLVAAAERAALDLFERDMQGYDFTPEEDVEDTNALVVDALKNSKAYVLAQLRHNTNTGKGVSK